MSQQTNTKELAKRVLINMDRCIECGSCAAACYLTHANMPVVGFARSGFALLPLICRQCKAASCVDTCPAEAMVRDENGVVKRRLFRCIGCGSCARACPFGVIPPVPAGVPSGFRSTERISGHQIPKCDLCEDRTAGGDDAAVPRCVAACPSGALIFADEKDPQSVGATLLGARTAGQDPYKRR